MKAKHLMGILLAVVILSVLSSCEVKAEASPSEASPSECRFYPEWVFNLNESDYLDLCLIVRAEAGDESMLGQMAVVEVIGNRILHEEFPDNCLGVLSQRGQFSTWHGRKRKKVMQSQIDAIEAVRFEERSVLEPLIVEAKRNGSISQNVEAKDYIFFCIPSAYRKVGKRYMFNIIQIGGHVFGTNRK